MIVCGKKGRCPGGNDEGVSGGKQHMCVMGPWGGGVSVSECDGIRYI